MAVFNLDEGLEPLKVLFEGREYELRHPADLTLEDLERLEGLSVEDVEGDTKKARAMLDTFFDVIAPDLKGKVPPFRGIRLVSWYMARMKAYVEGLVEGKESG